MNIAIEEIESIIFEPTNHGAGYCKTCDEIDEHADTEPYSFRHTCPKCGSETLYGLVPALAMGFVKIL